MNFPIHLKYPNDQTFIKVESKELLEEIRYMGENKSVSILEAKTFTDRVYIQDLIQYVQEGKLIKISKEEYEKERNGL